MQEEIKITTVIKNRQIEITHVINEAVMSTLLKEGLMSVDNCGGRGVCGRCRIRFLNHAPIPTGLERNFFDPEELRQGYRLACMAKPRNNCTISLEFVKSSEIDIVTDVGNINEIRKKSDIKYMQDHIDPDSQHTAPAKNITKYQTNHIIAVDLGTTTIAMQLMELESGKVIDTYCAMNPQRVYGADVLSRIQAAGIGHADSMKESVWKIISDGVDTFLSTSNHNISNSNKQIKIFCMCIAGNTTMQHLLMGLPTEGLGQSPFTPAELGLQKCMMPGYGFPVYITPVISAFVGGDIVAGLYHCDLLTACTDASSISHNETDAHLFIDLGTNGEMAIVAGDRIIVTATAAGPAFEGGAGAAVPGSDMIKITASLLEKGIIDETGLLSSPYFDKGIDVTVPNQTARIHFTQADIRALQMAKAAIRAGIDILCQKIPDCRLTRVYLAGGFGYYLDVNSAITIGLLPELLRNCTTPVGNTSLSGAFDIAKTILTNRVNFNTLTKHLNKIEIINLAQEESFERLYISYLNFPNTQNTEK